MSRAYRGGRATPSRRLSRARHVYERRPQQANVGSVPVHAGDVVILASDGLFDNVSVDGVAAVVEAWERGPDSGDNLNEREMRH